MAHYDCKYCGRNGCISECHEAKQAHEASVARMAAPLARALSDQVDVKIMEQMKPAGNYTIQNQEPMKDWVPSFLTNILATLGRVKRFVIIDPDGTPYLERITLRERPDGSATMLHVIYKSDDDRGMHDHPWDFAATLIHGAYRNHVHMPKAPKPDSKRDYTAVASSAGAPDLYQPHGIMPGPYQKSYIMQRGVYHRLELLTDIAVTLVEHGPKLGEWGFLVDGAHVPHEQFIREKYGQKGEYQGDGTTRINRGTT